jgi:CRISPR-associated protein Cmr6
VEEWQDNTQEQDFIRFITGKREDSEETRLQELQKAFNGQPIWESEKSPILRELPDNVKRTFGCYQLLFGAAGFKGLLTFLDLYPEIPEGENFFELDVMTPHYAPYYQDPEKNHPGDWYNPKPIPFLTVKPGVRFRSVILFDEWRYERLGEKYRQYLPDKKYILPDEERNNGNILEGLVKEALENFGVGAKTRLGYGRFKDSTRNAEKAHED